jgi:hypothetical protein
MTSDGRLAFTVRLYRNQNAHIKVNQDLMLKFNIEVARLRHWINCYQDIEDEFEVSPMQAFTLWNFPSVKTIGHDDIKLLGFGRPDVEERKAA